MFLGPPAAPQNVRVKENRLGGLILIWNFVRSDLKYYDMKVTRDSTKETNSLKLLEDPSLTQEILEYELKNLEKGESYSVMLRAVDILDQVGKWSEKFTTTTVTQLRPTVVNKHIKSFNIGEGSNISMSCGVQAEPPPTYIWFRNNVEIKRNTKYIYDGSHLTMISVKHGEENDDASYKCEATNSLGSVTTKETKMIVECMY